ncbi:IS1/IS1595 family N-terminal zinc-binding domain-containing protein [Thermodesulfatator indicus]|nr:topoisomerase DNA-binding C4 zinc finger domain-containing protein [Thermodesulfatator indicus]
MENKMKAIKCPFCGSQAYNRYGKTKDGLQRYRCLVCNKQFTEKSKPNSIKRPSCPQCGQKMYVYMKTQKFIRWRCSRYPECSTYLKIALEEENNVVLPAQSEGAYSSPNTNN